MTERAVPTILLETIDSTSTHARRLVEAGRPMPFVVVARTQTAGRGQFSRAWSSPDAGLWCTLAWRVETPVPALQSLGGRIGEACLRTINDTLTLHGAAAIATLKPPNDILIDNRKVLGVLTETFKLPDASLCVLVGVGVNANFRTSELPPEIAARATTLMEVTGKETDLGTLRESLVRHLIVAVEGTEARRHKGTEWKEQ